MTTEQITMVQNSWKSLRDVRPEIIGDVFYTRLFLESPELKPLFHSSIDKQSKKLVHMLNVVVARLDRLDELIDDIRKLAVRHVSYGVKPAHYDLVGAALLWTLKTALGLDWTDALEKAWTKCYTILAGAMIAATSKPETTLQ